MSGKTSVSPSMSSSSSSMTSFTGHFYVPSSMSGVKKIHVFVKDKNTIILLGITPLDERGAFHFALSNQYNVRDLILKVSLNPYVIDFFVFKPSSEIIKADDKAKAPPYFIFPLPIKELFSMGREPQSNIQGQKKLRRTRSAEI